MKGYAASKLDRMLSVITLVLVIAALRSGLLLRMLLIKYDARV